ncbi:MAG: eL32 family ribosomal protein [Candidatus Pacearchaeota archaeon]|jgi:ribosomal protein L32E
MTKRKFLRTGYSQYSKLGLRRKNKQVYRKSNGTDNKIRLKMKGHLRNINIGFRTDKTKRNTINGTKIIKIYNIEELKAADKNLTIIVGKVGTKNKMELAEYSLKNNIRLHNLNSKRYLDEIKDKLKQKKERKDLKIKKKEKKTKEKKEDKTESKEEKKIETKPEEEKQ